ncbi:Heparan sulfate 2-O-sulfotransferase 1 [Nymphon striatum]|nr:Heparan sulfate 2-O-sulfotransferase 1 [Nymphon striatum]
MSLFKDGLMREPTKAVLRNALLTEKADVDPNALHVLDGGALLHKVRWSTSVTYREVCDLYVNHIKSKYGIGTIVFDGYMDGPSTKDHEHARRSINKRRCADVQCDLSTKVNLKQDVFYRASPTNLFMDMAAKGEILPENLPPTERAAVQHSLRVQQVVTTATETVNEDDIDNDGNIFDILDEMFNETQPIYINVVREPIDRLMSSFYYKKDIISNRLKNKNKSLDNEKYRWLNLWQGELNEPNDVTQPSHVTTFFDDAHSRIQTYDDCIKEQYVPDGCSFKFREPIDKKMVIPFFCGQSSECRLRGNKWALNMAKYNIENHYAVVGVLEHMDKTLSVLEKYLPAFFSGVSEIYQLKRYHLNKSDGKRMIKPENLKIAKSYLSSEYDLYNFVIQRLDIQFNKIHHD